MTDKPHIVGQGHGTGSGSSDAHLAAKRDGSDLQQKDNQHKAAGEKGQDKKDTDSMEHAPHDGQMKNASTPSVDTKDKEKHPTDEQRESLGIKDAPMQGTLPLPAANNVIEGRHLGEDETPSDELKEDGSKSPHDDSSDGSRQRMGIEQAKAALKATEEMNKSEKERAGVSGAVSTPSPEQAESGKVAKAEGRAD